MSPRDGSQQARSFEPVDLPPPAFGELTQSVHHRTREAILSGALAAGGEVSQVELARQLGVSRTPLREALRLLEREGLVVVRGPHRLVQVSALSMPDLDELYAMRVAGEAMALRLTVRTLRTQDLALLRDDLDIMATLSTGPEALQAHRRFHAGLRAGAGERLRQTQSMLFEHAERYQRAYLIRGAAPLAQKQDEHRQILDACDAGDEERAVGVLVDHIASTAEALMAAERYAPRALRDAVTRAKAAPQ